MKTQKDRMYKVVAKFDDQWDSLLRVFISNKLTNIEEELNYVFTMIEKVPEWKIAFLPNEYNKKTLNWGVASSLLRRFPWVDLVSLNLDRENNAFIHFSPPFLKKFIHVNVKKNIHLFITKTKDNIYRYSIGVPFYTDPNESNYIEEMLDPTTGAIPNETEWLLYDLDTIINMNVDDYKVRDKYTYLSGITNIDNRFKKDPSSIFDNILEPIKYRIGLIQKSLKDSSALINTLRNIETQQPYLENLVKNISLVDIEKRPCSIPLCNNKKAQTYTKWDTVNDFIHKNYLQKLSWQYFMINRLGAWHFSPFNKNAPVGFVSMSVPGTYTANNIGEGNFIEDITEKKPLLLSPSCSFKTVSRDFDDKVIFKGKTKKGTISSCKETKLKLHFDEDMNSPFLTRTLFIKMKETPTAPDSIMSLTLGVSLDNLFQTLAFTSGDLILITKNKFSRYYHDDGKIEYFYNVNEKEKKKLISNKSGIFTNNYGKPTKFTKIANITHDDGVLVCVAENITYSLLFDIIYKQIDTSLKKVSFSNIIISIIFIVIVCLILLKVISKLTRPINELAKATSDVEKGKIHNIDLPKKYLDDNDEVGKLYQSFSEMIKSMQDGEKVRSLLDKVVSKEVAKKIIDEGVNLTGEIKHITLLFCDIRGFTSISEHMKPQDILKMLNECLTLLSDIIDSHQGVIDNFEGDCIMALFGAPIDIDDHAQRAVKCALDMQKSLSIWNKEREANHLVTIDVGIGIHTGDAVAGNVGTENHLSYSVIGHMVNLTSRICNVAKAKEILITQETLNEYPNLIVEEQPSQKFKGISDPVVTFVVKELK